MGSIGSNTPRVTLNFALDLSWGVNAVVSSIKSMSWNIGDLPLYWFRVMGDCQPVSCPTSPVDYPQRCEGSYLQMVLATTPQEVCQKLARSQFVWRITEMGRFSTPASSVVAKELEDLGMIDRSCNAFIPVPHCQYQDCLPFCLVSDNAIQMGAEMTVQDTFFRYVGTGGLRTGGSALVPGRPDLVVGSGGITISGSAAVTSSNYQSAGVGGIVMAGEGVAKCNFFRYAGTGGIGMSGKAAVTSTHYAVTGTGGVSMSGTGGQRMKLSFASSGLSSTGPSFAGIQIKGQAGESAKYYYRTSGSGGIGVGGASKTMSSYFATTGSGGISISGHAPTVSPDHHAAGTGGVAIGGTATTSMSIAIQGGGGMSMGGSAGVAFKLSYAGTGGIAIGGSAAIPDHVIGTGGMTMGGSAVITSTWKGLYVADGGMEMVCENLEPVFGEGVSVALSSSNNMISQCGATSIPQTLELAQNFNDSDTLTHFMGRNGFNLPSVFEISYHRLTESWRGNYHFVGAASDETSNERWDFLIDFGCTAEVFGTSNAPLWKFGFYIQRKNETSGQDFDTRIVVLFDPEPLASRFNSDGVDLDIRINPFTKRVTVASANATVESFAFFDGIGLFKNKIWKTQPFSFRLKDRASFRKIPRYDILPIFPKAGEFDLT